MIELEISELFLWVWCIGATAAAIYFRLLKENEMLREFLYL